ncbi:MAG TPA: S8 family serine peptidase [Solirubrobacteraceae bacterium]|nr:S8 family serine peptidase [Solirubrobacteraceae bacterium]
MDGRDLNDLIFGGQGVRRFTQDSPVLPDVWIAYWEKPGEPQELLLTPYAKRSASDLAKAIRQRLQARTATTPSRIAYTATYVAVSLTFDELLWAALPLSRWWWRKLGIDAGAGIGPALSDPDAALIRPEEKRTGLSDPKAQLTWFVELAGLLALPRGSSKKATPSLRRRAGALGKLLDGRERIDPNEKPLLWTISRNRPAHAAVWRSGPAIKADAAERLFHISCEGIRWAVIDSGIDATHPAFKRRGAVSEAEIDAASRSDYEDLEKSRVVATYDFTRLRDLQSPSLEPSPDSLPLPPAPVPEGRDLVYKDLERSLRSGRTVDWDLLEPLLRVPYDGNYRAPTHEHGTHVAGILAANWPHGEEEGPPTSHTVAGICPQLEIYDLRVLDDDGEGEEFAVVAALQFIRHLNNHSERRVIHGVNLSLSIRHDVRNFACGRTPVCDEAERLVGNGVVVVAAAGNEGFTQYSTSDGFADGYRTVSITDPGNAEAVITVGATHRYKPHTYGISYFSSRGPTGDGRCKPDLVAPGEKIKAPVPGGGIGIHDGTSMAAPHVSGAAALLMGRHRELIGQPAEVKQTLCRAATDLGRERHFQGSGMVDVLRAIQSV